MTGQACGAPDGTLPSGSPGEPHSGGDHGPAPGGTPTPLFVPDALTLAVTAAIEAGPPLQDDVTLVVDILACDDRTTNGQAFWSVYGHCGTHLYEKMIWLAGTPTAARHAGDSPV